MVEPSSFQPGDVIAGKYRVERILGRGGMGLVVVAMHIHLDERVAIKFLLPTALEQSEAVQRFSREARAAARIKSEHVARVQDVGTLEDGCPYMVMEYLDGSDLRQVLKRLQRLSCDEALDYVLQAGEAIAEAHVLGIVHRDLKPANLFLSHRADGSHVVKVLDFGISKLKPREGDVMRDAAETSATMLLGSPLHMAPEQMTSTKDADHRADIWSVGIILYELVAGRRPFEGGTLPQICAAILANPPAPLAVDSAPPELEAIIGRCLQKHPDDRYQTMGELAEALRPIAPDRARVCIERIKRLAGLPSVPRLAVPRTPHPASPMVVEITAAAPSAPMAAQNTGSPFARTVAAETMPVVERRSRLAMATRGAGLGFLVGGAAFAWIVMKSPHRAPDASANAPPPVTTASVVEGSQADPAPNAPSGATGTNPPSLPADTDLSAVGLAAVRPPAPVAVPAESAASPSSSPSRASSHSTRRAGSKGADLTKDFGTRRD